MINIIKLLTDSFESYKKNFRNIILMALPIFIISSIGAYYSVAMKTVQKSGDFANINIYYFIIAIVIYLIAMLFVGLFFVPAFNRAIQKNEDDKNFDVKSAYNFQKRNIWKWIKVNLWGLVYGAWRLLPYMVVSALLITSVILLNVSKPESDVIVIIFAIIASIIMIVGMVLNITRFVFYKNVFFAKDHMKAKNTVIESMTLGKTKNLEIWKVIVSILLFSLMMFVLSIILSAIAAFIIFSFGSKNFSIIDIIISPMISAFMAIPVTLIIIAKGYNKIRGHHHVVEHAEVIVEN
jgi:hypothetical protein